MVYLLLYNRFSYQQYNYISISIPFNKAKKSFGQHARPTEPSETQVVH